MNEKAVLTGYTGRKAIAMKKERKRTWTKETAKNWVGKVENGKEPRGLKFCSAMSYLRNHCGKVVGNK